MSRKGINAMSGGISASIEKTTSGSTTPPKPLDPSGALPAWVNPALDESWTPPPPPTTPPEHLETDQEREHLALARATND